MTLLFLYLVIALLFSFLCSLLEAILLSITPTFVAAKAKERKKYTKQLIKYKEKY